jgi:hypothetical protein
MRCRFCDTEIADKALICYRCGKPTVDARVAAPPPARPWPAVAGVTAGAAAVAAAVGLWLDGAAEWAGWTATVVAGAVAIVGVWRRSLPRR